MNFNKKHVILRPIQRYHTLRDLGAQNILWSRYRLYPALYLEAITASLDCITYQFKISFNPLPSSAYHTREQIDLTGEEIAGWIKEAHLARFRGKD